MRSQSRRVMRATMDEWPRRSWRLFSMRLTMTFSVSTYAWLVVGDAGADAGTFAEVGLDFGTATGRPGDGGIGGGVATIGLGGADGILRAVAACVAATAGAAGVTAGANPTAVMACCGTACGESGCCGVACCTAVCCGSACCGAG